MSVTWFNVVGVCVFHLKSYNMNIGYLLICRPYRYMLMCVTFCCTLVQVWVCVCAHVFLTLWGHKFDYTVTLWGLTFLMGTSPHKVNHYVMSPKGMETGLCVCVCVCVANAGRTGWAWQTLATSSQEAPYSMAKAASLIISPAPCRRTHKQQPLTSGVLTRSPSLVIFVGQTITFIQSETCQNLLKRFPDWLKLAHYWQDNNWQGTVLM